MSANKGGVTSAGVGVQGSGYAVHLVSGSLSGHGARNANARPEDTLIGALAKQKDQVKDLTVVSNNVGSGEMGLGAWGLEQAGRAT